MKIILGISIFLLLVACNETNEEHYRAFLKDYEANVQHYRIYRKEMLAFSKKQVGEAEYNKVYNQFLDTLKTWRNLGAPGWRSDTVVSSKKLDELICFNDDKTKLVGAMLLSDNINIKPLGTNKKQNLGGGIEYLQGAKINGKWYFFGGDFQVVAKEGNSDLKKGKSISFFQLENYCVEQVLGGYMKKDRKMNHKWFDGLFDGEGWSKFKDRYQYKSNINGFKIDDEKEFHEFKYIRKGLNYRIGKIINDSLERNLKMHPIKKLYNRTYGDSVTKVRNEIIWRITRRVLYNICKYPDQTVWEKE